MIALDLALDRADRVDALVTSRVGSAATSRNSRTGRPSRRGTSWSASGSRRSGQRSQSSRPRSGSTGGDSRGTASTRRCAVRVRDWILAGYEAGNAEGRPVPMSPPAVERLDELRVPTLVLVGSSGRAGRRRGRPQARGNAERAARRVRERRAHDPAREAGSVRGGRARVPRSAGPAEAEADQTEARCSSRARLRTRSPGSGASVCEDHGEYRLKSIAEAWHLFFVQGRRLQPRQALRRDGLVFASDAGVSLERDEPRHPSRATSLAAPSLRLTDQVRRARMRPPPRESRFVRVGQRWEVAMTRGRDGAASTIARKAWPVDQRRAACRVRPRAFASRARSSKQSAAVAWLPRLTAEATALAEEIVGTVVVAAAAMTSLASR